MDIAYYISDLLGQQGELTVPNLGYFVQIRMPAYYDSAQKKFFPPHYSVQFDPQIIDDDDSLADHITTVKKISISSAKYFIEKYINNLKSQSFIEEVPFANLGSFSSDGIRLSFNTQNKTDDPAFFAYQALDVVKIGEAPVKRPEAPIVPPVTETAYTSTPVIEDAYVPPAVPLKETVVATPAAEEKFDSVNTPFFGGAMVSNRVNPGEQVEEEEPKRFGIWLIVGIVFTLLIIGLGVLYKFKPELFGKAYVVPTPVKTQAEAPTVVPTTKDSTPATPATQNTIVGDSVKNTGTAVKPVEKPAAKPAIKTKDTAKINNLTFTPDKNKPSAPATVSTIPPGLNNPMPAVVPKGADVITAGAFNRKGPAEARVKELKRKGFEQARLMTEKIDIGGNYKVILGVYASKEIARQAYKEFLATGKLKKEDISVEQNKKSLD